MPHEGPKGYFITGTDTDVGKTVISLALVEKFKQQGFKTGVMKPVSAGCELTDQGLRNSDAVSLQKTSNVELDYDTINPYAFAPPIAPHIAAVEKNTSIDIEHIKQCYQEIAKKSEHVIVEGAGGWMVPLNSFQTMADIAMRLQTPVILVVGLRLGCLSHTLLTVEAIRYSKLPLAGWIANHLSPNMPYVENNIETLKEMIDAPLIGCVPYTTCSTSSSTIANYLSLPMLQKAHRPLWAI